MLRLGCFLIALVALSVHAEEKNVILIEELNWFDKNHLSDQVEKVDDLTRSKLGLQIHGDKRDIETLQRVIHRGLIKQDNESMQQALGAVLGNIMVNELGLEWKHYVDRYGRSRAACAPATEECLFPITMLSRRMKVGLMPNVDKVYNESTALIVHLLPKSPYHVD
ncbi:MAG: DUF3806 domain-containing protein [Cellvibrionaceae bacterium]